MCGPKYVQCAPDDFRLVKLSQMPDGAFSLTEFCIRSVIIFATDRVLWPYSEPIARADSEEETEHLAPKGNQLQQPLEVTCAACSGPSSTCDVTRCRVLDSPSRVIGPGTMGKR